MDSPLGKMTNENLRRLVVWLSPVWQVLHNQVLHPLWRLVRPVWRARISYLLLLPFLVPFLVFVIYPITWSAWLSTTEYHGIATQPPVPATWDGHEDRLGNFKALVTFKIVEMPRIIDEETGEPISDCELGKIPESQVEAHEAEGAKCKKVLRSRNAAGEQLYTCEYEKIPDSEARTLQRQGATCEAIYERPRQLLPKGYQEFERISFRGKLYLIGATDQRFIRAIYNTIRYAFAAVFLSTMMGLFLALALQKQSRLNFFFRTLFFLPSVTSSIAIGVVWRWILTNEDYGLMNAILRVFGQEKNITFLANPSWTLPILIAMAVWGGMGYNMILFLAGLQGIPAELYEAAAVDGANTRQRFWHITLPMLRPTMLYVVVVGSITAFQVFEAVYIVFNSVERIGGVLDSGLTVVPYLYDRGFTQFDLGYASAIAWILFTIIFVLTMINLWIGRKFEAV